jgi:hypothetical protein
MAIKELTKRGRVIAASATPKLRVRDRRPCLYNYSRHPSNDRNTDRLSSLLPSEFRPLGSDRKTPPRKRRMEPLWSPVDATRGNQRQIG